MKFKQIFQFLLVSCLIAQTTLAMDGKEETPSAPLWLPKTVPKTNALLNQPTDLVDKSYDVVFPKKQQSQTSFFLKVPDEITLQIFSLLCHGGRALKRLAFVALTCRKGYELTQHPKMWEWLNEAYVPHLPEEYINLLIKDKKEQGLALARTLMQQFFIYQTEEIKQLNGLLSKKFVNNNLMRLDNNFKVSILYYLNCEKNLHEFLHPAEIYVYQEKKLSYINTCLVNAYLKLIHRAPHTHLKRACILEWGESLTRLPQEAIALMKRFFAYYKNPDITLLLENNQLRWVPSELFSLKKIRCLNLQNNKLGYLPMEIEQIKDDLKTLFLGNYDPRLKFPWLLYDETTGRTAGNKFTTLPPVVFKLKNLQNLLIQSVTLEEFPDDKLYEALPRLSFINISHNNLKVLPQSTFKDRQITVNSLDNPVRLAFNAATRQHYKDTLFNYRDICIYDFLKYSVFFPLNFIFSSALAIDHYMQGSSDDPGFSDENFISREKDS